MTKYDEKSIEVLKGLDGIRKRPSMYIGDIGVDGFHHLLWEILDNSVTRDTPIIFREDDFVRFASIGELVDANSDSLVADSSGVAPKSKELFALSYTKDGKQEWRKITRLYRHKRKHRILKLRLQNGLEVEITDCHSVFKWEDGCVVPVTGKSLSVGDSVVVPSTIRLDDPPFLQPATIDMLDVLDGTSAMISLPHNFVKKFVQKHRTKIKKWCLENYGHENHYSQFYRFGFLPVSMVNIISPHDIPKDCQVGFKSKKVNRVVTIDKSFVELVGLFVAEGCIRHLPNGGVLDATLSFGSHEDKLIKYASHLTNKILGRKCRVANAHATAKNIFLGKEAAYLMNWIGVGVGSHNKRIPMMIWNLSRQHRERFLIAIHAGDGYPSSCFVDSLVGKKQLPEKKKFVYSTVSSQLIDDVAFLLLSLDKTFSIRKDKLGVEWYKTTNSSYRYRINGKKSKCDVGTLRIKSIVEVDVLQHPFVYDISVEGNENFVGGSGCILLHNSIDEAIVGCCDVIEVVIHKDGSATISDNGRGIPVKQHPKEKIPTVDVVFTMLHAGGKFGHKNYSVSGGLHGVGAAVVNALSEYIHVTVWRDGKEYYREYNHGDPTQKTMKVVKKVKRKVTGTIVAFKPDKSYFKNCDFSKSTITRRLRELAFLNAGLEITFVWELDETTQTFYSEGGLPEYVEYLVDGKAMLHPPIHLQTKDVAGCAIDLAFVYDDEYDESVKSFANNIPTIEGGVHLNAALDSLSKVITQLAQSSRILKGKGLEGLSVNKSDITEGLTLVINAMVPEPQFGGQTKTKLSNADLRMPFGDWMQTAMEKWLKQNKSVAKLLCQKIIEAIKARDAARKAKTLSRKKSIMDSLTLPGKLADCTSKDAELCELMVVEGDSAGGTAIMARDRTYQAILPLRGKVLNVGKTTFNTALKNKEIGSLISALGIQFHGKDVLLDGLRYHKIILMADADADGGHICCLLLTLFHKYMKKLIEEGHLYVCDLPLYRVRIGMKYQYIKDDEALDEFKKNHSKAKMEISRFKGLGEMEAEELAETAMNPATRRLKLIHIEDAIEARQMFEALMGGSPEARKKVLSAELQFEDEF